jgi:hypothetical protein
MSEGAVRELHSPSLRSRPNTAVLLPLMPALRAVAG